jgi:hypothetical protein
LRRSLRSPSGGTQPPATVRLHDGELLHLSPLAYEISRRFQAEYPDEQARDGDAAFEWCMHDNQWLLAWAAEDVELDGDHFVKNVRWLQRVLQSRDYPSERLVRDLEIAADVVGEDGDGRREVARRLREGAKTLRPRR